MKSSGIYKENALEIQECLSARFKKQICPPAGIISTRSCLEAQWYSLCTEPKLPSGSKFSPVHFTVCKISFQGMKDHSLLGVRLLFFQGTLFPGDINISLKWMKHCIALSTPCKEWLPPAPRQLHPYKVNSQKFFSFFVYCYLAKSLDTMKGLVVQ